MREQGSSPRSLTPMALPPLPSFGDLPKEERDQLERWWEDVQKSLHTLADEIEAQLRSTP